MTVNFCLNKINCIQIVAHKLIYFYPLAVDTKKVVVLNIKLINCSWNLVIILLSCDNLKKKMVNLRIKKTDIYLIFRWIKKTNIVKNLVNYYRFV